jgi:transcription elongation factor Elf1
MAIKVIKHGTKVFRVICPICGCEFEYELDDLTEEVDKESLTYGAKVRVVKCPECGEKIKHKEYTELYIVPNYPAYPSYPTWPAYPTYPYVTWSISGTELDCDKCLNKPDPNNPVVGDTPCTWCKKNQPYCTNYIKK